MSFGLMPDLPKREGGSDAYSTLSPESTGVVDPVFSHQKQDGLSQSLVFATHFRLQFINNSI
jgi:hypothetical protein